MVVFFEFLFFLIICLAFKKLINIIEKRSNQLDDINKLLIEKQEHLNQRENDLKERELFLEQISQSLEQREKIVLKAAKNVGLIDEYEEYGKNNLLN